MVEHSGFPGGCLISVQTVGNGIRSNGLWEPQMLMKSQWRHLDTSLDYDAITVRESEQLASGGMHHTTIEKYLVNAPPTPTSCSIEVMQ